MKSIIVYYSLEGNSKMVAESLAKLLGSDLLELKPKKPYPTGRVSKYLGGKDAMAHKRPELMPYEFRAEDHDRIIIGTPVWAGQPAPPINTFLTENDLSKSRTAFFACCAGGDTANCIRLMKEMAGADEEAPTLSIVDPAKKPSKEKMQAIQQWGIQIIGRFDTNEDWDLYDADRNLLGRTMKRGSEIPEDAYHIVTSVWMRNSKGQYLMSKRSEEKKWCPGMWETTGGAVESGETSLEGAVREVREELGIELDPKGGRLVRSVRSDALHDFYDVWMFDVDVDIENIVKQDEEVSQVRWMTKEEIDRLWDEKKLHVLLDYYKEIID
jgi:8-oxo-dGTP pyrophosphatase MutT (NUDIX family)/flavodoxin